MLTIENVYDTMTAWAEKNTVPYKGAPYEIAPVDVLDIDFLATYQNSPGYELWVFGIKVVGDTAIMGSVVIPALTPDEVIVDTQKRWAEAGQGLSARVLANSAITVYQFR